MSDPKYFPNLYVVHSDGEPSGPSEEVLTLNLRGIVDSVRFNVADRVRFKKDAWITCMEQLCPSRGSAENMVPVPNNGGRWWRLECVMKGLEKSNDMTTIRDLVYCAGPTANMRWGFFTTTRNSSERFILIQGLRETVWDTLCRCCYFPNRADMHMIEGGDFTGPNILIADCSNEKFSDLYLNAPREHIPGLKNGGHIERLHNMKCYALLINFGTWRITTFTTNYEVWPENGKTIMNKHILSNSANVNEICESILKYAVDVMCTKSEQEKFRKVSSR